MTAAIMVGVPYRAEVKIAIEGDAAWEYTKRRRREDNTDSGPWGRMAEREQDQAHNNKREKR